MTAADLDHADRARAFYEAVDGDEYDRLGRLLDPAFVHVRPDRTIEGRDRFVQFMREGRPVDDTTHEVETVYEGADGVAVRGRLYRPDGSLWFRFVDVFEAGDRGFTRLRTYTADGEA
ncbi:MAG: nuclear transport factor 2 family protein [Halobacteriaceae archaeon]